jgi:flavin reductase (DIM6/NTAB) family NADH-FMN oxidoreductase RutF
MGMKKIVPGEIPTKELHQYLVGSVAPRPIAFASTMDAHGVPNLAPYSFFNVFSSNPPTLIFSSNRKVKDNTTKDTLHNVEQTGEVVINVVSYDIVRQVSLASIEYAPEVSEFEKAGFTQVASEIVKPFRVKESLVQFECKVKKIMNLGEEGGAGNLIINEVVLIHMDERIFNEEGKIDPQNLDLMGRMGRTYYARAHGGNIYSIYQPVNQIGIGFDGLPESVKTSGEHTGNELAEFAAFTKLPSLEEVRNVLKRTDVQDILKANSTWVDKAKELHLLAKTLLSNGDKEEAFKITLLEHYQLLQ